MTENQIDKLQAFITELSEIQAFADDMSAEENGDLLERRLTYLNSYLSRTGKIFAEARFIYQSEVNTTFNLYQEYIHDLSKSLQSKFVDSKCAEAIFVVEWSERLNRALVHQGDNIRTQISYEKMLVQQLSR